VRSRWKLVQEPTTGRGSRLAPPFPCKEPLKHRQGGHPAGQRVLNRRSTAAEDFSR
jgi:hypothetical protein